MSAPLAGKFQDHYAVLEIDPKADLDAIQYAHARLAQRYHPDNLESGDPEKFDAVNLANEILSDAGLRADFDKVKGVNQETSLKFTGIAFFSVLGKETALRAAVLCVLYDRRRLKPFAPSISMRILENVMEASIDELAFALWYLKQRNLISSDDKSSLQITVDGMDYLESNKPLPELVLPFIKPAAMAPPPTLPRKPLPAPEPEPEPVSKFLNRALARR
jgi:curved DNA-binding protein